MRFLKHASNCKAQTDHIFFTGFFIEILGNPELYYN
jgi:hypothetical protein